MKNNDNLSKLPIGVFDSGIGGLSVVKQIKRLLPNEHIIYFGDIARLPYGTKSPTTIRKFSTQIADFLLKQNVKAIVIACNTVSAVAKNQVKNLGQDIPVIDLISGGGNATIASGGKKIGVMATLATVNSGAYTKYILRKNPKIKVIQQACNLLVPLIEDGYTNNQVLQLVTSDYLQPLINNDVDTLILGCTHYPLIMHIIKELIPATIKIIDPAHETVINLYNVLKKRGMLQQVNISAKYKFYVTEVSPTFKKFCKLLLKDTKQTIKLVKLN
jgi:glutamate racemase